MYTVLLSHNVHGTFVPKNFTVTHFTSKQNTSHKSLHFQTRQNCCFICFMFSCLFINHRSLTDGSDVSLGLAGLGCCSGCFLDTKLTFDFGSARPVSAQPGLLQACEIRSVCYVHVLPPPRSHPFAYRPNSSLVQILSL
jgi:hypothetical protein